MSQNPFMEHISLHNGYAGEVHVGDNACVKNIAKDAAVVSEQEGVDCVDNTLEFEVVVITMATFGQQVPIVNVGDADDAIFESLEGLCWRCYWRC